MTNKYSSADAVEQAFYAAFANCDIAAMELVWDSDDVLCIHPGSSPISGHNAVMRGWTEILSNAELPNLQFKVLNRVATSDLAVHVVEEHISPRDGTLAAAIVLATNVYRRTDAGWLIVEHHASATRAQHEHHTLQ